MRKNAEELQQLARVKEAYEKVFSTEEGKIILNDLGKKCMEELGIYISDENKYIYNEGRRSIFMYLLDNIKLDFRLYAERFVEGEFNLWKQEMERQIQHQTM
jgi:hypothetical protein